MKTACSLSSNLVRTGPEVLSVLRLGRDVCAHSRGKRLGWLSLHNERKPNRRNEPGTQPNPGGQWSLGLTGWQSCVLCHLVLLLPHR